MKQTISDVPVNASLRDGNSSDKTGLRISTAMVSKETRSSHGFPGRQIPASEENQAEEISDDFLLFSIAKTQIPDYGNFITANPNLLLWFLKSNFAI